jgi:hypothetical protein
MVRDRVAVRQGGSRSGTARDRVAASQHKSVLEMEVFEVFKPPNFSKRSLRERRRYEGPGPLTDSLGKFCRSDGPQLPAFPAAARQAVRFGCHPPRGVATQTHVPRDRVALTQSTN